MTATAKATAAHILAVNCVNYKSVAGPRPTTTASSPSPLAPATTPNCGARPVPAGSPSDVSYPSAGGNVLWGSGHSSQLTPAKVLACSHIRAAEERRRLAIVTE